jgi:hypothetical protein
MEITQGISLYSYLNLKLAKTLFFFLIFFFSQQNWRTRGQNRFCPEVVVAGAGGGVQIMYTHVSKCKNDKIKFKKQK